MITQIPVSENQRTLKYTLMDTHSSVKQLSAFTQVLYLHVSTIWRYLHFLPSVLLPFNSEVNRVLFLHYIYSIPLVTLQMWMNDVTYNQVLNQTLVPPGVNSQATLQYTKSFKLAAPFPALRTLLRTQTLRMQDPIARPGRQR